MKSFYRGPVPPLSRVPVTAWPWRSALGRTSVQVCLPRWTVTPWRTGGPPRGLAACALRKAVGGCSKRTDKRVAEPRASGNGRRHRAPAAASPSRSCRLAPAPWRIPSGHLCPRDFRKQVDAEGRQLCSRNLPSGAASPVSQASFPLLRPSSPSLRHLTPRRGRAGVTSRQRTVFPLTWG